jgi:hypothetical protein
VRARKPSDTRLAHQRSDDHEQDDWSDGGRGAPQCRDGGRCIGEWLSAQDFIILFRSNDSIAKTYSGSIESGIASINTLFCKPTELVLTASQGVDLTDDFIAKHPLEATEPFGRVMMVALVEAFPCGSPK